jgi:BirA family biotin operon repressor/biotin-[acetyl-CoA-carboxylase] ligase
MKKEIVETIGSTNLELVRRAEKGEDEQILVAFEQTGGIGRMQRPYFCPKSSGIYISVLLRPKTSAADAAALTAAAAVAAARAAEAVCGKAASIKWVNDIFVENKKVCGILTQGTADASGGLQYAVVGFGMNIEPPAGGFPAELPLAGSLFERGQAPQNCAETLTDTLLAHFFEIYGQLPQKTFWGEYKSRCFCLGERVVLCFPNKKEEEVTAVALSDDFKLIVKDRQGNLKEIDSGEVRVRMG